MIRTLTCLLFSLTTFLIYAQERSPFYVGHSLINHDMPHMVQGLAEDAGRTTQYGKQIANGANLQFQYNNSQSAQGTPYTDAIPTGNYNALILTEAVPLHNHITWSGTYEYANNFYDYMDIHTTGQDNYFYIYQTWHCTNSGMALPDLPTGCHYDNSANSNILWQPRLLADFSMWSGIIDSVRMKHPSDDEIWMVPGGQAFYNLAVEINAGNIPGISSHTDLFTDDIHLTNAGNYFIACVMYATIYRASPVGLTTSLSNEWGTPFTDMPTASQAQVMQEVAWATVTSMPEWTGVTSDNINLEEGLIAYYPFNADANDASSNDLHGIRVGPSLSLDRFQVSDRAYNFDGSNDAIDINVIAPAVNAISAFSLSTWFSTTDTPQDDWQNILFSCSSTVDPMASGHTLSIGCSGTGGVFVSSQLFQGHSVGSGYNDGLDHHLMLSLSDTGWSKVYVDGLLLDSLQIGVFNWAGITSSSISGVNQNGSMTDVFHGTIDDVRLYDRVLEEEEIESLYNEGCIIDHLLQDEVLTSSTTMYARHHISLDNVSVNGSYELKLVAPIVTINENCTFHPGAIFRIIDEDGCINND